MIALAPFVLAEASAAGSAQAVSTAGADISQWHDFYMLAGTAAATLVGLLFVSLSFHLDVLLDDEKSHLLGHARETLLGFIYVLLVSLMHLIPGESAKLLGATIAGASLIPLLMAMRGLLRRQSDSGNSKLSQYVIRRRVIMALSLVVMLVLGIRMATARSADNSYGMVGVICAVLGNAVGGSWDLLVQVGRLKRAQAEAESKA